MVYNAPPEILSKIFELGTEDGEGAPAFPFLLHHVDAKNESIFSSETQEETEVEFVSH
jgi:hypothetical protein